MSLKIDKEKPQAINAIDVTVKVENEKILCLHCRRTATNGIKCKGICVADSDY
jgi:hypothetical protein